MKVLIIHNNNVLDGFVSEDIVIKDEIEFNFLQIYQASDSLEDFDSFLSRQVDELYSLTDSSGDPFNPDLLVLPFSLSEINPGELTGIQFAAHIRLDGRDRCAKNKPMLFLGPDSVEECLRLDSLASLLLTPGVYTSVVNSQRSLIDWINEHGSLIHPLSEKGFVSFLEKISIEAPSNYYDSHHSITNRWNILRWDEMFNWGDNPPRLSASVRDFGNSLYFKWLQATLGKRSHFKTKNKGRAFISDISHRKIVYIDDEISLGWGDIMNRIITNSGAALIPYSDFDPSYSRDELFERIKEFIIANLDGDCFLLDLRLHEQDHTSSDYASFTGHRIAKYIYEKNHGAQIVIFTASEKTVNYVQSEKYFSGYVIKENPKNLYDRRESYNVFANLHNAIKKACDNAFLRDYYAQCEDVPYLEDFFELLRHDDVKDARTHDINMRSSALNLIVFIEKAIQSHFSIEEYNKLKKDSEIVANVYNACIECDCSTTPNTPLHFGLIDSFLPVADGEKKWFRIVDHKDRDGKQKITDIELICASLSGYCEIANKDIDRVLELKNIRNKTIAHGGGSARIEITLLRTIFENVVQRMISKGILI